MNMFLLMRNFYLILTFIDIIVVVIQFMYKNNFIENGLGKIHKKHIVDKIFTKQMA